MARRIFFLIAVLFGSAVCAEETLLLIIRHGETDWNTKGLYCGWADIPLNQKGISQAKDLAHYIQENHREIAAIYSSDLMRSAQTAQETSKLIDLPITYRMGLREIDWGKEDGISPEEKEKRYGDYHKSLHTTYPNRKERWDHEYFPGAETFNAFLTRTQQEVIQIAKEHPGETIAVFTHGRVIKTMIADSLDTEKFTYPSNCCIAHYLCDPSNVQQPLKFVKIEDPSKNR